MMKGDWGEGWARGGGTIQWMVERRTSGASVS